METVGYIKKNKINVKNGLNDFEILKNIEILYGSRDEIEDNCDCIQFICAGVIITRDNRILIVNKSKKSTSSHSPEKDKTLLYVGGHLDFADKDNSNLQTFINGMKREILEETGYNVTDVNINPILIYAPTNDKSAKHLAIIFPIIIDSGFDNNFSDGKCKFVDIATLKQKNNLESWSEIIAEEFVIRYIKNADCN